MGENPPRRAAVRAARGSVPRGGEDSCRAWTEGEPGGGTTSLTEGRAQLYPKLGSAQPKPLTVKDD